MNKPSLSQAPNIPTMNVQPYERYLPSAFDGSLSMLEKINKMIHQLNSIGQISNDIVKRWNELMEWILGNGLSEAVGAEIDKRIDDGTFNELITDLVGDLTLLETIDKTDLVNAINEINKIAVENDSEIGVISELNTVNKNTLVEAINEMLLQVMINKYAPLSFGESTGHGVISGLKVRQQNVLAMAVEVGVAGTENIVHMKNGVRYSPDNATLAVKPTDLIHNRIDIVFVNVDGVISYLDGIPSVSPSPPTLPDGAELLAELLIEITDTTVNDVDITDKRSLKSLSTLKTINKDNLVLAINELFTKIVLVGGDANTKLGDLSLLDTVDKSSMVNAVNEVVEMITENVIDILSIIGDKQLLKTDDKSNIVVSINEIFDLLTNGFDSIISDVGNIALLATEDKSNIVNAVNEVVNLINNSVIDVVNGIGDKSLLETVDKSTIVNAINEVVNLINDRVIEVIDGIGDKSLLSTSDKSTIVNAINEVVLKHLNDNNELKESIVEIKNEISTDINKAMETTMLKINKVVSIHEYEHLVIDDDWTNAFRTAMNDHPLEPSLRILLQSRTYKINKSLYFTRQIEIVGSGAHESVLDFSGITEKVNAPYNSAIIFVHSGNIVGGVQNSENPILLPKGQVGDYGLNSKLIDLTVQGSKLTPNVNGIFINCPIQLIRIVCDSFSNHGIVMGAYGNVDGLSIMGNANQTQFSSVRASLNGKTGIYITGSDSNVFNIYEGVLVGNGEWGIFDNSLLGGVVIGCQADGNMRGAFGGSGLDGTSIAPSRTVWMGNYVEDSAAIAYGVNGRNLIIGALGALPEPDQPYIGSVIEHGQVSYRPLNIADGDDEAYKIGGTNALATRISKGKLELRTEIGKDLISLARYDSNFASLMMGSSQMISFPFNDFNTTIIKNRPYMPSGIALSTKTSIESKSNIPSSGSYDNGQIIFNSSPIAGGYVGWICTVAGNPGTWKGFGLIEE